jgi:hypothetical protein
MAREGKKRGLSILEIKKQRTTMKNKETIVKKRKY